MDFFNYPIKLQEIYQDYNQHFMKYIKYESKAITVRYFNIDLSKSVYDDELNVVKGVFNPELNGLKYNEYGFTPVFEMQQDAIDTSWDDKTGYKPKITLTMVLYTIKRPLPDDLIMLYKPMDPDKVYRVVRVRPIYGLIHSLPVVEVDLELAPIKGSEIYKYITPEKLLERYFWSYELHDYVDENNYKYVLTKMQNIDAYTSIINNDFNKNYELYVFKDNNTYKIPLFFNIAVKSLLNFASKTETHSLKLKNPFGINFSKFNKLFKKDFSKITENDFDIRKIINTNEIYLPTLEQIINSKYEIYFTIGDIFLDIPILNDECDCIPEVLYISDLNTGTTKHIKYKQKNTSCYDKIEEETEICCCEAIDWDLEPYKSLKEIALIFIHLYKRVPECYQNPK